MSQALFPLGQVVATPGALEAMREHGIDPVSILARHVILDPGQLDAHDRKANRDALKSGARIFSAYMVGEVRVWCITEGTDDDGNRASTCILLPSEY